MKENNGFDAFADDNVEGLEKYYKRHADTVTAERAAAVDEKIRAFNSRERTVEWAKEATAFCDSVEPECRELAGVVLLSDTLPRIRKEAELILENYRMELEIDREEKELAELRASVAREEALVKAMLEVEEAGRQARRKAELLDAERNRLEKEEAEQKARLADEKAELEREAAERRAAENRERAREMTEVISGLDAAKPSSFWSENVEIALNEVRTLPREVTLLIPNLDVLDAVAERRSCYLGAQKADADLLAFSNAARDSSWCESVKKYCAGVAGKLKPFMAESELLTSLPEEADELLARIAAREADAELSRIKESAAEAMRELERYEAGEIGEVYTISNYKKSYEQQVFVSRVRKYLRENTDFEERYKAAGDRWMQMSKQAAEEAERKKADAERVAARKRTVRNALISGGVLLAPLALILFGSSSETVLALGLGLLMILVPYFILPLMLGRRIHRTAYFVCCDILYKVAQYVLVIVGAASDAELGLGLCIAFMLSGLELLLAKAVVALNGYEFRPTHEVHYGTRWGRKIEDEPIPACAWIKISASVVGAITLGIMFAML